MRTTAFLGFERGSRARALLAVGLAAAGAMAACSGKSDTDFTNPSGAGASGGSGGSSGAAGKGSGGNAGTTGGAGGATGGSGNAGRGGSAGMEVAAGGGGKGAAGGKGGTGGSGNEGGEGCVPTTCEAEGAACGSLPDGCDGMIQCGNCPTACTCGSDNRCVGEGGEDMERRHGQHARSSGFAGTQEQYNELYDLGVCQTDADCGGPCLERGGTEEMCAGNYCMESTENYCLPATIWTNVQTLVAEGSDIYSDGAQLVLWSDPYRDFLIVDDFKLEVPASATILGITITVRRAAGGPDEAVDAGVHIVKGGVMGDADRSTATPWNDTEFANIDFGGPTDLWGETWTPADVNDADFGVAFSAAFTQSAGNGRAYVDIVYATVHYTTICE